MTVGEQGRRAELAHEAKEKTPRKVKMFGGTQEQDRDQAGRPSWPILRPLVQEATFMQVSSDRRSPLAWIPHDRWHPRYRANINHSLSAG